MRHTVAWLLLLAVVLPRGLPAQSTVNKQEFRRWARKQLDIMSDTKATIEERTRARDAILGRAGPDSGASPQNRIDMAEILTGDQMVPPLLKSKDAITTLNAAIIAAGMKHVYFVPVLEGAVGNPNATVRYWAAKGLGDAQVDMYSLGGRDFFQSPLRTLAQQAAKEDSPPVAEEIYRALTRTSATKMTDARKNEAIFSSFMTAFTRRAERLDEGKTDGCRAEVTGLAVSGRWFEAYRNNKVNRNQVVFQQGQLLQWAVLLYDRALGGGAVGGRDALEARLAESTRLRHDLELVIIKAVELLSKGTGELGFQNDVRMNLLIEPKVVQRRVSRVDPRTGQRVWVSDPGRYEVQSRVLDVRLLVTGFVGGPGLKNWKTKEKLGVDEPAKYLTPRKATTQPGE